MVISVIYFSQLFFYVMFCVFVNLSCNFQVVKMDIIEGGDDEVVIFSMVDDVFFIV